MTDGTVSRRRGAAVRLRTLGYDVVAPALVLLLALGAWYLISLRLTGGRRRLLPPPDAVVHIGFLDPDNRAELLQALTVSARVALLGLAIAVAVGTTAAVLMSQARWLERSLYPYAVVLQTIPILAMVPLFGFWLDYGFEARVLVCVLVALFPIIANTLFGLSSTEQAYHDMFTLHGAGRLTRLVKLQLPAALPAMFTGLRISAGLSVIGAVVGDFFFRQSERGIGILIDQYRSRLQSEQMFAAVIIASLFGLTVFWVFGWLNHRVAAWHQSTRHTGR